MRWRKVTFADRYSVSDTGLVRDDVTGETVRDFYYPHRAKLKSVWLLVPGGRRIVLVRDIVALAFLEPKPDSFARLRHKDGCYLNNAANNLYWFVSPRERHVEIDNTPITWVRVEHINTGNIYETVREAAKALGEYFSPQGIHNVLSGRTSSYKGQRFRRVE